MENMEIGSTFQMSLDYFLKEQKIEKVTNLYDKAYIKVQEAMQYRSKEKHVFLAQEALAICDYCIEAYLLYASTLENGFERIEILHRGYEKITIYLGKEFFIQKKEDYYDGVDAMRFFKMKYMYALSLFESGFFKDAKTHFEQILNLNPTDTFKVREHLYILYLYDEDLHALKALLERFKEQSTLYVYVVFLLQIKRKEFIQAQKIIPLLKQVNPILFEILTYQRLNVLKGSKDAYAKSEEEAAYVYSLLSILLDVIQPLRSFLMLHI